MDSLTVVKRVLGLGSVAFGVAALMAPRQLATAANLSDNKTPETIAAFGAKEVAAGAALLAPVKPGPFLWARVAGDLLDLVGLGAAMRKPGAHRALLATLGVAALAMLALDIVTASQATKQGR